MPKDTRLAAQQDVRARAKSHALLLQAVQGCILLLLDLDGGIRFVNPGGEAIAGHAAHELEGGAFQRLFSAPDQAARWLDRAFSTAADQGRYEADGWLHSKDGSALWATLTLSPVREAGQLCGYAALIRDISEKRVAEEALFNSEQRFRMLVQGVRDYAIYMLDPGGYITNWNAGAALIKGYTAEEIVGRHYSMFYTEEDRRRGEPERSLKTALRENTFQAEAWRVRKDGTPFWASVVIDPIHDEQGRLMGFAKITRDITHKKRDEDKAARQREALHHSQKLEALGRLTGSVAHDFNNMLAIIRTAAELLGEGRPRAHDLSHYVNMITETSERAAGLTGQLLAFARQQPLRLEVFEPAARIAGLIHVMETSLGPRNSLRVDLADDLASIESDVSQFETAILNLVINARDAMGEGGALIITARNEHTALEDDAEAQEWVMIEVRDTGSGIEEQALSKIFEPFFTTKAVDKGTGLGLSQVYGFVKQSGGDIKVASELNKGTRFTVYLPPVRTVADDSWQGLLTPAAREALAGGVPAGAARDDA